MGKRVTPAESSIEQTEPPAQEYDVHDSGRSVTDERVKALMHYLEDVQRELGLTEWRIVLKYDLRPDKEGMLAQIETVTNRYIAQVRVAEDFFAEEPHVQRNAIVHELLHVIEEPIYGALWETSLDEIVGKAVTTILTSGMNAAIERVTDRLAGIIAESLPLPALDGDAEAETPPASS